MPKDAEEGATCLSRSRRDGRNRGQVSAAQTFCGSQYFFAADAREIRDAAEAESAATLRTLDTESPGDTPSHEPSTLRPVQTAHLTLMAVVVGALIVAADGSGCV
jgi:hypothetical protein